MKIYKHRSECSFDLQTATNPTLKLIDQEYSKVVTK